MVQFKICVWIMHTICPHDTSTNLTAKSVHMVAGVVPRSCAGQGGSNIAKKSSTFSQNCPEVQSPNQQLQVGIGWSKGLLGKETKYSQTTHVEFHWNAKTKLTYSPQQSGQKRCSSRVQISWINVVFLAALAAPFLPLIRELEDTFEDSQ